MPSRRAPNDNRANPKALQAHAADASGSSCISDTERNVTNGYEQRHETPMDSAAQETLSAQRTELQLRERIVQVQEKQLRQEEGLQALEAEVRSKEDKLDTLARLVKRQDDNTTVKDNKWDEFRHRLRELEMDVGARKEQLDSLSSAVKRQGDYATAMDDQWEACRKRLGHLEAEVSARVLELDNLTRTADRRRFRGFQEPPSLLLVEITNFIWTLAKVFIIMKVIFEGVRIAGKSFDPYLRRKHPELVTLCEFLQRFNEDATTSLLRTLQDCGLWPWSRSPLPKFLTRTGEDLIIFLGRLWRDNFPTVQDKFNGT